MQRAALLCLMCASVTVTACRLRPQAPPENTGVEGGRLVYSENFDGDALPEGWSTEGDHWSIDDGWLAVEGARNDAFWLSFPLPDDVRIEWDARAVSDVGDLKFEIFGDGEHHESGYIGIFGGWSNSLNIIARLDEHGEDRLVGADGIRVEVDRTYAMSVVRTDARVRWYVDGEPFITYDDPEPLEGDGHRHFAFNDWDAPVRFDNVRVFDLAP